MSALLSFQNITKEFVDKRTGKSVRALDGLDLDIHEGEFVCVLGPSGCGKSTLLAAAAGNDTVTSGQVRFDGEVVQRQHHSRGMVFQVGAVFPWLTAFENVCYGPKIRGLGRKVYEAKAREVLGGLLGDEVRELIVPLPIPFPILHAGCPRIRGKVAALAPGFTTGGALRGTSQVWDGAGVRHGSTTTLQPSIDCLAISEILKAPLIPSAAGRPSPPGRATAG